MATITPIGGTQDPSELPATWKESVLAALPLLLFAAGAFLIAFFLFQTGTNFASTSAPLWSLFAALGVVTTGGGVAVIAVERGAVGELGAPVAKLGPTPSAAVAGSAPRADLPDYYEGTEPIPSWVPPARRQPAPSPVRTPAAAAPTLRAATIPNEPAGTDMDRALDEMQATLERLAAEGRPRATPPVRPAPAAPPERRGTALPPTWPISVPDRIAPAAPTTRAATGPMCTSCGLSIGTDNESRPCVVCGQRLCWLCELKTLEDGHYLVCDRCAILAAKEPGDRRAP
jgi:hypothetical protein